MMENRESARAGEQAWYHRYPRGWPILLFLLTAAVTLLSVVAVERAESERRQLELERNATEIATGLQRRAAENIAILAAAAALFETRQDVTYEEFTDFASGLYSQDDYHGSLGMGWARVLDVMVVPGFEAAMRVNLDPDYVVFPRPDPLQKITIPIVFLSPLTEVNRKAIGFDLYSEATRRAAMDKAISLRQPVMSGPVNLVQDRDRPGTAGFLLFMPVFQDVVGRPRIMGFVYSPFRASEFLKAANELSLARDVEIALYDEQVAPDRILAWRQIPGDTGLTLDRRIEVGHHSWILRVSLKSTGKISRVSQVMLIAGLLLGLLVMIIAQLIIRRATEDRRTLDLMTQQAAIRNSLTRELNHRVKNTLANVLSIVALTRRRATDIDDFADGLGARLRALSATHDLLSQSNWSDAPVGEIVRSELAPYMGSAEGHVTLDGPEISLAPKDAMSLGLAIHELATNAAKYGALSVPGGNVSVTWRFVSSDLAEIRWRESGGPPVSEPEKRGFGRDLIEKIVAHELRSKVDLQFRPEGVECTLQVPVRKLGDFALRAPSAPPPFPA
jgi:two-component sensor histidine kinase